MVFSAIKIMRLQKQVNDGKWRQDPSMKQKLLRTLAENQEELMGVLIPQARSQENIMVDTANVQTAALRTLTFLREIGADWAFSEMYFDSALLEDIEAAARFEPKAHKFDRPDLKAFAGALLVEIEARWKTGRFIPTIMAVLGNPRLDEARKRLLYSRLDRLLHVPEIVAHLTAMSKGPLRIPNPLAPTPKYLDGMGAYALSILLGNKVEESYSALLENRLAGLTNYDHAGDRLSPAPVGREYFIEHVEPGGAMADLLIAELQHENIAWRSFAMDILREIRDLRAVDPLIHLLEAPEEQLLSETIHTLGILGDPRAIPPIIPFLAHGKRHVRRSSKEALENLRGVWSTGDFVPHLTSNEATVREFAAEALGKTGDETTIHVLQPLVEDPDRKVRKAAQKAMKNLK